MRRRAAGMTLVEVAAGLTILGIVVAILIPAFNRSSRFDKVLDCRANLKALHQAQAKAPAPGSNEFGRAYWVRLTQATPPLASPDLLRCPLVTASDAPPCHYMGPSTDPSKLQEKDPLGCDFEQNHSHDGKQGGNVLLKSGEVVTDHTGIWGAATRQGKCRP